MPLARYFFFVGGVLLALLFIADACLPKLPVADRANADLPVIRIHSDRKWPERVVYDTSLPTNIPAQIANTEASVPAPAAVADVPAKTQVREAFAQLQPSDARQLQQSEPKKAEAEAATQTQDCKAAPGAADDPGGAATAVWLVWQQHLVIRRSGRQPPPGPAFFGVEADQWQSILRIKPPRCARSSRDRMTRSALACDAAY